MGCSVVIGTAAQEECPAVGVIGVPSKPGGLNIKE